MNRKIFGPAIDRNRQIGEQCVCRIETGVLLVYVKTNKIYTTIRKYVICIYVNIYVNICKYVYVITLVVVYYNLVYLTVKHRSR